MNFNDNDSRILYQILHISFWDNFEKLWSQLIDFCEDQGKVSNIIKKKTHRLIIERDRSNDIISSSIKSKWIESRGDRYTA